MAAWHVWLKAMGKALWNEAPQAILGLIPFGDNMARIAAGFWKNLREAQPPAQDKPALEALVNAPPGEVKAKAAEIAQEIAPPEARQALARTLELAAPVSRRVLARAEDQSGKTVPQAMRLDGPLVIGRFVPPAPPRFQEGAVRCRRAEEGRGEEGRAEARRLARPQDRRGAGRSAAAGRGGPPGGLRP
ncbi:MAG: hypothetical protein K2W96_00615 [Gemmataceae bacterium]|nr:hypothetical protein [Gemmataceae bacterium]